MSWTRRAALKAVTAISLIPKVASADTAQTLSCTDSLELSANARATSVMATTGYDDVAETWAVKAEYGQLTINVGYRAARSDAERSHSRRLRLTLRQPGGTGAMQVSLWTSAMRCPTNSCDAQDDMQLRLMLDNQAFARVRIKAGEARDITAPITRLILTDAQERELRQGRKLWLEVATRTSWERGELSIRELDDWLKTAEGWHRDRIRSAIRRGDRCKSVSAGDVQPCYMTTLIGHLLKRDPSAFEQRQMNKLQPRFAQYPDHIEAYVQDAMQIGDRRNEPSMRAAFVAFYGLVIWPAALMISVRAVWLGALWYFSGFQFLKAFYLLTKSHARAA